MAHLGRVPLNAKQRRFVAEYLVDLDALNAARRAGYSPRSRSIGTELLQRPAVRAAIDAALAARAKRAQLKADDVLVELALLGRSDVRWFRVDAQGELALADGAPAEAWRAVQSVTVTDRVDAAGTRHRAITVKLWPKVPALELIGKHLGAWREPIQWQGQLPPLEQWTDEQVERVQAGEDPSVVFGRGAR